MGRSTVVNGRRRSDVTLPGYRLGMKPANAGMKYPVEVPTTDEVLALMGACSRRGSAGIRDRALIMVLWRGGLRISEALSLRPRDIDLEQGAITVLWGKGKKRRIVGIDPQAVAVIELWLRRRSEKLAVGSTRPVFCNVCRPNVGHRLDSSTVRTKFKELGIKAGIEKRTNPHSLRHACASHLARKGVPIHLIRRQLGHASLRTTERYINDLSPWDVVDAVRAVDWGAAPLGAPALAPVASISAEPSDEVGDRLSRLERLLAEQLEIGGVLLHQRQQINGAGATLAVNPVDHQGRAVELLTPLSAQP